MSLSTFSSGYSYLWLTLITPCPRFSRLVYAVVRLADGSSPSKRDFKKENFEKALSFLNAPEAWITATMDFVKSQYSEVLDVRAMAICAITRFQGVAEFGFERGVFDRPYWLLPSASETRHQVRNHTHYLTCHTIRCLWLSLVTDMAFAHTGR